MKSIYFNTFLLLLVLLCINDSRTEEDQTVQNKKVPSKKDPRDYTDADVDKLFDEWEENDEVQLPEDERHDFYRRHPHGKHPPPMFKPEDMVGKKPEDIMKISKKGHTLMMFATVSGNPTRKETEEITQIWLFGMKNALYDVNKYVIDDNRILLVLQDGSQAFEIKDFLVQQDRCQEVTIDNRPYYGKGAAQNARTSKDQDL